MGFLQDRGLGLRTISNHITRIGALLRKHKIVDLLSPEDKPQYDEPEVEAYSPEELTALFAAATAEGGCSSSSFSEQVSANRRSCSAVGGTSTPAAR
jgi:hypothetical protein